MRSASLFVFWTDISAQSAEMEPIGVKVSVTVDLSSGQVFSLFGSELAISLGVDNLGRRMSYIMAKG